MDPRPSKGEHSPTGKTMDEVMDNAKFELAQIIEQYQQKLQLVTSEKDELRRELQTAQNQSAIHQQNADSANLRCITLLRRLDVANQRADDEAQGAERKFYADWLLILKQTLYSFPVKDDEILGRFEEMMLTYEAPRNSEPSTLLIPGVLKESTEPSQTVLP